VAVWCTEDQPRDCEMPVSREEAEEIKKQLETDIIPLLKDDTFLVPYLSLMLEEMEKIHTGTYK